MPPGRPPSKFVQDHFKKGREVPNDSRRFYYHCLYCNDETEIQHRDNELATHITSSKACPNAPQRAREEGLRELLRKGKVSRDQVGQPLLLDAESSNNQKESSAVAGNSVDAVIPSKKRRRRSPTLVGWVDVGLSERQIGEANLALFR